MVSDAIRTTKVTNQDVSRSHSKSFNKFVSNTLTEEMDAGLLDDSVEKAGMLSASVEQMLKEEEID